MLEMLVKLIKLCKLMGASFCLLGNQENADDELLMEAMIMTVVGVHENLVSIIGVITSGFPHVVVLSYCEVRRHVDRHHAPLASCAFCLGY